MTALIAWMDRESWPWLVIVALLAVNIEGIADLGVAAVQTLGDYL